jgi:aromatic ring-opening dioxygenase LigB subunit
MTLSNVYITPHGDELVTLPNKKSEILATRLTALSKKDHTEVLAIISPHGLRLGKNVSVIITDYFWGYLKLGNKIIRKKYRNEKDLSLKIIRDNSLAEEASFITSSGPKSVFPLDFGSLIPLYFFNKRQLVVMGQPRIWRLDDLETFGRNLFHDVDGYNKKVSVLFSADQAHTHSKSGPYGYSDDSKEYENIIERCVRSSNFESLRDIDKEMVDRAKPDSFWNMIILKGFMEEGDIRLHYDYHYVENYFGMLLAHGSIHK